MGAAMAANLTAAGYRVIAYVRRPDQMDKLAALGLKPTTEIAHLFDCEVMISMLPDDTAVRDVVLGRKDLGIDGLASGLKRGAIRLSMNTISTFAASDLAREHARHGQGYVAAPVFGNPDAAKARQLFIVAAGAQADVERCQPLFDSLGQKTFVIGTDPGHANLIKLLGNMMSATTLEMLGEVVAVARKRGLDPKSLLDVMTSTCLVDACIKSMATRLSGSPTKPDLSSPWCSRMCVWRSPRRKQPAPQCHRSTWCETG
jgi:3-hydroxyisobutyrate dehydrogenase-like beta-hydroxyacid dehydrogenase